MVGIKNNRRTKYTIQAIQAAFFKLLEKHELRKITVTQICKQADINRGTFYLHYESSIDLFKKIEADLIDKVRPILALRPQEPLEEWLKRLLFVLKDYGSVSRIILENYRTGTMINKIFSEVHDQVIQEFKSVYQHSNDAMLEYYFSYFVQGCVGALLDWFNRGFDITVEELTTVLTNVIPKES